LFSRCFSYKASPAKQIQIALLSKWDHRSIAQQEKKGDRPAILFYVNYTGKARTRYFFPTRFPSYGKTTMLVSSCQLTATSLHPTSECSVLQQNDDEIEKDQKSPGF
jgi:hypothetical protein